MVFLTFLFISCDYSLPGGSNFAHKNRTVRCLQGALFLFHNLPKESPTRNQESEWRSKGPWQGGEQPLIS